MRRLSHALACGVTLLLAPLGVASAQEPTGGAGEASADATLPAQHDPARMGVADVATCMRGNVVDRGSLRELEIVSIDREESGTGCA